MKKSNVVELSELRHRRDQGKPIRSRLVVEWRGQSYHLHYQDNESNPPDMTFLAREIFRVTANMPMISENEHTDGLVGITLCAENHTHLVMAGYDEDLNNVACQTCGRKAKLGAWRPMLPEPSR